MSYVHNVFKVLVSVRQKMATKKIFLRLYPTNATYTEFYFSSKFYTDVTKDNNNIFNIYLKRYLCDMKVPSEFWSEHLGKGILSFTEIKIPIHSVQTPLKNGTNSSCTMMPPLNYSTPRPLQGC